MTLPKTSPALASDHEPVLVAELLQLWQPQTGHRLLDGTLGLGGHALAFLKASAPAGTVVGFDADLAAATAASQRLADFGPRAQCLVGNYSRLPELLRAYHLTPSFSHFLLDLGVGSHQLSDPERSFSFRSPGPLRMRYGSPNHLPPSALQPVQYLEQRLGHPPEADELLRGLKSDELAQLLRHYSEERYAHRIAAALKRSPLPLTGQALADRIKQAVPATYERGRLHPATRTFQALRLSVNRELEALGLALAAAPSLLSPGGLLTVISFHSLEDRIVKSFLKSHRLELFSLTKKPLRPTTSEIARNPRARSAKLRAARRRPP